MVRIYTCDACEKGDHKHCEIGHSCPPGQFGGSICRCGCKGDPDWMKNRMSPELWKLVENIMEFDQSSKNTNLKVS